MTDGLLGREFVFPSKETEAADELTALRERVEALRALVYDAYIEGHQHGRTYPNRKHSLSDDWKGSSAHAHLLTPESDNG